MLRIFAHAIVVGTALLGLDAGAVAADLRAPSDYYYDVPPPAGARPFCYEGFRSGLLRCVPQVVVDPATAGPEFENGVEGLNPHPHRPYKEYFSWDR